MNHSDSLPHNPINGGASWAATAAVAIVLTIAFVGALHGIGRIPWCECGFGLWTSDTQGRATSQHLADPYSFTHILHGIIFYWAFGLWRRTAPIKRRFLLALLLEVVWELVENSPAVIDRYREATAAQGYYGDSILNAFGDLAACALGFLMAARLPPMFTVAFAVSEELVLLAVIRDNLALNVLMLFVPIKSIKQWQLGA